MARIRSIKPTFWTSRTITELQHRSETATLLFLAMWNYADDEGREQLDPTLLRAFAFPRRGELGDGDIKYMIQMLVELKLIISYQIDGVNVYQIRSWDEHQKIDRRSTSSYPPPNGYKINGKGVWSEQNPALFDEPSTSPRRVLGESSPQEVEVGSGSGSGYGEQSGASAATSASSATAPVKDESSASRSPKPPKPLKASHRPGVVKHLEHVYLTPQEHARLVEEFGADATAWMINKLDCHIPNSKAARAYIDHNRAIRSWVVDAWKRHVRESGFGQTPASKLTMQPRNNGEDYGDLGKL